jgi:CheY-like chemotaxis protein
MTIAGNTNGGRTQILVIDDEEVVRILFQSLLEDQGYAVLLAEDGQTGVDMLARYHPPLALVDKNLPDVSGLDLITKQKQQHPNTEFIMITGYASLDSAVKAMEAGAFSYLTKPFDDLEVVMDRIRAALEVTSLRIETSVLKQRLDRISSEARPPDPPSEPGSALPGDLVQQLYQTIQILESFLSKREHPPSAPMWTRFIDTIEEETRRLKSLYFHIQSIQE